jgi:hypothetical protein
MEGIGSICLCFFPFPLFRNEVLYTLPINYFPFPLFRNEVLYTLPINYDGNYICMKSR